MKLRVVLFAFCVIVSSGSATAQENHAVERGLAFDAQAHHLYARGQYRQAYTTWAEALEIFMAEKYEMGISGATIQMAQSQRYLGFPIQACKTLRELMSFEYQLCDPDYRLEDLAVPEMPKTVNYVVGVIALGNILRDWGQFNAAELYLDYTIEQAQTLGDIDKIVGAKNARANVNLIQLTLRRDRLTQLGKIDIDLNEAKQVLSSFDRAFQLYESVLETTVDLDTQIKWLTLYQEQLDWFSLLRASDVAIHDRSDRYENYLQSLDQLPLDTSPIHQSRQKLEISKIYQRACEINSRCSSQDEFLIKSILAAKDAVMVSQPIRNSFWQSHGYGQLGRLYDIVERNDLAIQAFQRAANHARRTGKPAPLYLWEYELGKKYEESGDIERASEHLKASVTAIKKVEWKLTPLSQEIRTDFQETVRPIFNHYLGFLLNQNQPDYETVLTIREQFRLSEIQNYLRCGSLDVIPTSKIAEKDSSAVVINILRLETAYHVIAQTPAGFHHHTVRMNDIDADINRLNIVFEDESSFVTSDQLFKQELIRLHRALIAPVLPKIPKQSTLLFSNDANLQRIPMAMLSDGAKYLIEEFKIVSLGEKLYEPMPLAVEKLSVFFAGISEYNPLFPNFEALAGVNSEAEAVRILGKVKKIQNNQFTARSFLSNLSRSDIVHVATHGQFSSDPERTFLAAWDQPIRVNELIDVVRTRVEQGLGPIELLVLSACETAKGDRKASLGIAGFSIQSGARSTVASLWDSDDQVTALLMKKFYTNLQQGQTKVDSLRNAQLSLLRDARYENPYYWANFILVGSWL